MRRAENTSNRRMGPVGSTTWHAMLDGAEDTLREEGYAALTSRRIAERIGVKQRLVYYYFQTMEELIVESFRRLSSRELERLRSASLRDQPLREIWNVCVHTSDARLTSEFMALAHRIEGLKSEVIGFIEESRAIQVQALEAAMARKPDVVRLPPVGFALLATSTALSLLREAELGVRSGHPELLAAITETIDALEPLQQA